MRELPTPDHRFVPRRPPASDAAAGGPADSAPVGSTGTAGVATGAVRLDPQRPAARRQRRERRGRGLRSPLLPAGLPGSRTRAQQFDQAVLDAVAELEAQWEGALDAIEFAVDEVPPLPAGPVLPSDDVVLDGGVPLTRFVPPGVDHRGRPTKARVVVYRRPLEVRAAGVEDLGDLVAQVLIEQVTAVLGEPGDATEE